MEHRDIPNNGLHEPKDIVFAAPQTVYVADGAGSGSWGSLPMPGVGTALEGQVYKANGAGGGGWDYLPGGWAIYEDTGLPFIVTPAEEPLTIDGDGASTNEDNLPKTGSGPLWQDDRFIPVNFNDVYGIEFEFEVASASGATNLTVKLGDVVKEFDTTAGVKSVSLPLHIFLGDPVEVVEILLSCDAGTVDVTNRKVKIVQLFGAL